MRNVNFLGLGFELGQKKSGLADSHLHFFSALRDLRKIGLNFVSQGSIRHSASAGALGSSLYALSKVDWHPYEQAFRKIRQLLTEPTPLLNWGGDHSVALSTVGAFHTSFPDGFVLWIDAHADLNIPSSSPSGNIHGMPVSFLLNWQGMQSKMFPWIESSLRPDRLIYLGLRDLDPFEKELIQSWGIYAYSSEDIEARGMRTIATEIFEKIAHHPLHISFDIDSVRPQLAPSTGVPSPGGLHPRDLRILGSILRNHSLLKSVDVVEINPEIGTSEEVFQTYLSALNFIIPIFNKGDIHDGIGRSHQNLDTAPLESRP